MAIGGPWPLSAPNAEGPKLIASNANCGFHPPRPANPVAGMPRAAKDTSGFSSELFVGGEDDNTNTEAVQAEQTEDGQPTKPVLVGPAMSPKKPQ